MRIFARRERPHPGAQLTLFEAEDGWHYSLWVSNPPRYRHWIQQARATLARIRVQTPFNRSSLASSALISSTVSVGIGSPRHASEDVLEIGSDLLEICDFDPRRR